MPDSTPTETKTPSEFQALADDHNTLVEQRTREKAEAQAALDKLNEFRDNMIADAGGFGVTPKWARTVLRKG
jgi:hypothetical protein